MKTDNELIAEFMECWNSSSKTKHIGTNLPFLGNKWRDWGDMRFESSWDWLMPVVQKLENDHAVTIEGEFCSITACDDENGYVGSAKQDTKIESVYMAVLSCIKWYDSKK